MSARVRAQLPRKDRRPIAGRWQTFPGQSRARPRKFPAVKRPTRASVAKFAGTRVTDWCHGRNITDEMCAYRYRGKKEGEREKFLWIKDEKWGLIVNWDGCFGALYL